jgi:phage/plasmid primase-like uncharacterized protein
MLTALAGALGGAVVKQLAGTLIDKVSGAFAAHQQRQMTRDQLAADLQKALVETFAEVEKSHGDALARTYESFMGTVRASREIARMFKVVIYSQTFVLVWHQWFIPFYLHFIAADGMRYPSSGATAEWAYLLIGGLCGAAPMLLRAGPGAGSLTERLKRLTGQ